MTHTQTQGADGAGTNPFGAPAYDPASEIATKVMALPWASRGLTDPRSGVFDHDALGDRHGAIQTIADKVIRAALAPAATPGVPDSLREELARGYHEMRRLSSTGRPAWEDLDKHDTWERSCRMEAYRFADQIIAGPLASLIAAQPAGQAGDAGERVAEIVNRWHDWIISASADMDQPEWSSGNRQTMEDDRNYLLSLLPGRQPAPNSTRTGAAETPRSFHLEAMRLLQRLEMANVGGFYVCEADREEGEGIIAETLAALAARPEAPSDAGWKPITGLAAKQRAVLGRWCRCGDAEDGSEHWYWQQGAGFFFEHEGERHWSLDSGTFEGAPFYGSQPTHFLPVPPPPARPSDPAPSGQAES